MELFRRQQREPLGEVEPHLRAEQRQGAGAGAVHLLDAFVENLLHQVEILAHGPTLAVRVRHVQRSIRTIDRSASDLVRLRLPTAPRT